LDRLFTMRVFLQVVDTGSFAAAARSLDLSKPMITRAVAQLEAHLRARLLHRSTRNVTATEVGTEYAERCREILAATAEAEERASLDRAAPSGSLRIAMPSALGLAVLAPLIATYCKRYPEVSVDITLADRPIDLVEEGFDVAVVVENMLRSDDVITKQIAASRFVACGSPHYLSAVPPQTLAHLRDHRVLCLKSHVRRLSAEGCTNIHVTTNTAMLRALAHEGLGIAILPAYLVAAEIDQGSLVEVLKGEPLEHVDIHVAYPSRKYVPAKVAQFVEMSQAYLGALNLRHT
jgi:DNA-binding transcriptional LysR family regulator